MPTARCVVCPQAEFAYSTERILKNFSNYSAFHHRTIYIKAMLAEGQAVDELGLIKSELELIQQAIFTEPDDQTAWWYHQYLVAWAGRHPESLEEVLRGEVEGIRGLLEDGESTYRWAILTLASLLSQLAGLVKEEGERGELLGESRGLYEKLSEVDPDHKERYREILQGL